MKKILALTIVFVLFFASCGEKPPEPTPTLTPAPAPTVTAVPVTTPEPTPEPKPEDLWTGINPLTGLKMDAEYETRRPVAIMLNNLKKALPQYGVSMADIIYEVPAEGGITRMLGIFQNPSVVPQIGTVRSARPYYLDLAQGHDAIFMHAGGSEQAYKDIRTRGVTALDCLGAYEGTLYWRDKDRIRERGLEHSAFTSGEKIAEHFPTYKIRLNHESGYDCGLKFSDKAGIKIKDAKAANTVSLRYSSYKTGVFEYEPETGLYAVSEYGEPYIDGIDNSQVKVTNVLVLFTSIIDLNDADHHLDVKLVGSGTGKYICGGKVTDIKWSKKSQTAPFIYTFADGRELEFKSGKSYINIVSNGTKLTIE